MSNPLLQEVTDQLRQNAVRLFVEPFDKLLGAIETQRRTARPS